MAVLAGPAAAGKHGMAALTLWDWTTRPSICRFTWVKRSRALL
nr:MAG TPA: hypothetical protein [Caudoviricetes sp.]